LGCARVVIRDPLDPVSSDLVTRGFVVNEHVIPSFR
jgi:hypothetical protein